MVHVALKSRWLKCRALPTVKTLATQGRLFITTMQAVLDKRGIAKTKGRSKAGKADGGAAPRAGTKRSTRKPTRFTLRWIVLRLAFLILLLCLAPFLLMLAYSSSSVHPVSTLMVMGWVTGEPVERTWVSFEDISPFVYQSVVSSEDGQFCNHKGVDWEAVDLVVDDLLEGERPRGASTIPMQTVKNLFLWNSRSYVRKVLEVPLALAADRIWGKRRMMEIYLNVAEWGPGIFGIEAAARHHFNRSAKKLNRRQAAMLTVTLPNPIVRNPRKPNRGLQRLGRLVEKRARQSGAYVKCLR